MIPAIIGISSGLVLIIIFEILKQFDKKLIYGFILTGIGFLYVGYGWSELNTLIVNSIQAIVFVFLSYYGIKKSVYILAAGYFLHGTWDIAYNLFGNTALNPPHYDTFCLAIDFTIGIYILLYRKHFIEKKYTQNFTT